MENISPNSEEIASQLEELRRLVVKSCESMLDEEDFFEDILATISSSII
ncbi:MAG: hypothetical protein WCR27_10550 [Eubacteriales bacterium]